MTLFMGVCEQGDKWFFRGIGDGGKRCSVMGKRVNTFEEKCVVFGRKGCTLFRASMRQLFSRLTRENRGNRQFRLFSVFFKKKVFAFIS